MALASPDRNLSGEHRACVPKDVDLDQIAQIMLAYADRNPSSRELATPIGLGMRSRGDTLARDDRVGVFARRDTENRSRERA